MVRFAMYNEPTGGEAYWQERQNVRPDAQERYTVLLGETTPGGLPPDIFASRARHWLGVQVVGQPEDARILLVELPSAWKPDPVNAVINTSATVSKRAILPRNPRERHLVLALLIMFLAGTVIACAEVVRWWKGRMEQFEPPPLANLITYVPGPDRRWHVTEVLPLPVAEKLRSIRQHFAHFVESTDKGHPKEDGAEPEGQQFVELVSSEPSEVHSESKS
jgi:hypothetical protein